MFAIAVMPAASQTPAQKPAFEVVSIKARAASSPYFTGIISIAGGRLVANDNTLTALAFWAYRSSSGKPLLRSQIIGLPSWADTDHFDFQAKPEGESRSVAIEEMRAMVQEMLEDRFQLKAHKDTRDLPVYELVVAKGGLKMKKSEDQTPPVPLPPADRGAPPRGAGPAPDGRGAVTGPRGGPGAGPFAGGRPPRGAAGGGRGNFQGTAVTIATVVNFLTQNLGRPVIDKTGLSGLFDLKLEWTPGAEQALGPFGPEVPAGPGGGAPPPADAAGPSIFTALQEQLGLRLESTKGPVEVVVIDSAARPSEN